MTKTKLGALLLAVLFTFSSHPAKAELIVALMPGSALITFTSENPGEILSVVTISGLQPGEGVLGIDARPSSNQLYALTDDARLYTLNPTTGVATLQATLTADPVDLTDPFTALIGTRFGIDFNPVPDRLRVVSDADQSLRINPDTGTVTTDSPLAYAAGDPSVGLNPQIVAAAYTNNDTDAGTPTTLFVLEQELYNTKTDTGGTVAALSLVRQGGVDGTPSPNLGALNTVGAFGRDGVTIRGFDVGPAAKAFVAVELINTTDPNSVPFFALVKVLLAADPLDPVEQPAGKDESLGYIGDGQLPVVDIAAIPSVQFDTPLLGRREGTPIATLVVSRHGGSAGTGMVDYSTSNGTAIAGLDYLTARGTLVFDPGEVLKIVNIVLPNDAIPEDDETFKIFLSNPQNVTLGGASVARVRISANDAPDTRAPFITHFGLTGPSRGITGAVIGFNEDLDPVSASNLANYTLVTIPRKGKKTAVAFTSAIYDPNTRTVTLGAPPFVQTDLKGFTFVVRGKQPDGVKDFAGNLLDGKTNGVGGKDAVLRFAVVSGTKFTIKDTDGDQAVVEITGGGTIDANLLLGKRGRTQFWILDPIALRSTVNGTITKTKPKSDGLIVIAEIIGLDKKEFTPLITNPAFRVNTLTFSTNATGR